MKNWKIILAGLVATLPALAETTTVSQSSHFHLLSTKCESEAESGPESTPQSPPLEVDDPATPGCNQWEINVIASGDLTSEQKNLELPLLDINYGIGDNLQLKYELPYLSSQLGSSANVAAIGESKVGVKYMFFEDEDSKLQLAIYPQLSFVGASSAAVARGLATPGDVVTLPLLMAKKIGETSNGEINLTANLGYNISMKEDESNSIAANVGVGMPLSARLAMMGELSTEQATSAIGDEARFQLLKADVGVVGSISRNFLAFASFGHSIVASDDQRHVYGLVGMRLNILSTHASAGPEVASNR